MARTVRERLRDLIKAEPPHLSALIIDILRIEDAHRQNHDKSARDKIENAIFKAAEEREQNE
jgi:hypothetical protein